MTDEIQISAELSRFDVSGIHDLSIKCERERGFYDGKCVSEGPFYQDITIE